MIIGFCGDKGAGKDAAATYLIKEYGFQKRAFATALKEHVATVLKIPVHEIEMFKNDPKVFVAIGYKNEPTIAAPKSVAEAILKEQGPQHMWSPISEVTFRHYLMLEGTDGARDLWGEDFWVDKLLPVEGYYRDRKIVITDVRFQNEVDRIIQHGGMVCRIKRPGLVKDPHRSEAHELLEDVHYEIHNEGTVEELYGAVEEMVQFIATYYVKYDN